MIRIVSAGIGGLVLSAGMASAAFMGVDIREDKDPAPMGVPDGARTFNIYAQFDNNEFQDAVLSVGQPDLQTSFGVNTDLNPGATFYQNMFGGNTAPGAAFIPAFPDLAYDTFVTIGKKVDDGNDNTSLDPDFSITSTDIFGGWFNSSPPSRQGEGEFNPDTGMYETVLAQLTIQGLAGTSAGFSNGLVGEGAGPNGEDIWEFASDVVGGSMIVFTQGAGGGAVGNIVNFVPIPSPGAAALFGVAGIAGLRRRRA